MPGVFDYVSSASFTKKDMSNEENFETEYVPFLVNKAFSMFPDSIFYAARVNCIPNVSKRMQYKYYLHSLRPRKRYSKWVKNSRSDDLVMIREHYQCSWDKAKDFMTILSDEQIEEIRSSKGGIHTDYGGRKKD